MPEGILHLANRGACSWQEYAQWALDCCHRFGVAMKATKVEPVSLAQMSNFIARRPVYTVLGTAKYQRLTGRSPREWRAAVEDYVRTYFTPK
jgi:dTDP-4-dehydrorhamnose reductase